MISYGAGLSESTQKTYASLVKNHLRPALLNTHDIGLLVDIWKSQGLAPNSILKLIVLYRTWHKAEFGTDPDTSKIYRSVNRETPTTHKSWTRYGCNKALDAARHLDHELWAMILFGLHTGARKSEILSVRPIHLDFKQNAVLVPKTKSGRGRIVPMSAKLKKMLKKRDFDPLFPEIHYRRFRKLCKIAKVEYIGWHGLRHTYATLLLDAGVSPRQVADLLGHAKVSTTMNIYWQKTGTTVDLSALP